MENNFASNLKHLRIQSGLTQTELAKKLGKDYSTIGKWELGQRSPVMMDVVKISELFNVPLEKLIGSSLIFDNAENLEMSSDTIKIPVLGVIKAGMPIEAQENILDYIDIPRKWTKGNKTFYALKISGDSMEPKYYKNDIVIFEQTNDMEYANNKDCAILIDGFDATFKKFNLNYDGITLTPYNLDNSDGFIPTFYKSDQIQKLPITVIGIAVEIRKKV